MYVCMYLPWCIVLIESGNGIEYPCKSAWMRGEIEAFGGEGVYFLASFSEWHKTYYATPLPSTYLTILCFFVVLILFLHSLYWHYSRWLTWKK